MDAQEVFEATTTADLVHKDQLALITNLCRKLRLDEDEECRRICQCGTLDLSVFGADFFINHLRSLQVEKATA